MRRWVAGLALLAPLLGPGRSDAADLRGEPWSSIKARVDRVLIDEMTRLWYPRAVDRERGGFHQDFAADWSPLPDRERSLVYQSRLTWTAAAFARHSPGHAAAFRDHARHGVAYLDRTMRDAERGGFHFQLDADGRVGPGVDEEKHVYGTAFALYAASEAYAATSDPAALRVARDAFGWLEGRAHDAANGGYVEALTRDGRPIAGAGGAGAPASRRADRLGVYYGFKSMNAHIHLLEAMAAYRGIEAGPIVEARLRELLAIVRDKIAAEPGALNLYLSADWRPAPAHDSFGHDVEAAYLLVEAAGALGMPDDPATWRRARSLVDHALDWGWDEAHGGFYDKGDVFAGPPLDPTKVWWVQAEGLNALLLMHEKFGDETPRYGDAFRRQWDFIERHLIDPVHGGWYYETTREGTPRGDTRKASAWKANYHTTRALIRASGRLGR